MEENPRALAGLLESGRESWAQAHRRLEPRPSRLASTHSSPGDPLASVSADLGTIMPETLVHPKESRPAPAGEAPRMDWGRGRRMVGDRRIGLGPERFSTGLRGSLRGDSAPGGEKVVETGSTACGPARERSCRTSN